VLAAARWRRVAAVPFSMSPAVYTADMTDDAPPRDEAGEPEDVPGLPKHLSALVGSLRGTPDLGRNHDKYLTYADREEAGGAASA